MASEFVCGCGNRFSAQDNHAGRWAVCPVCHREVAFDTGPDAGAFEVLDSGPPRRPFWKDPMIVFGWGGPFVALAIFCAYRAAVPRILDGIWPPNISAPQRAGGRTDRAASVARLRDVGNSRRNPKIPIEVSYPVIDDVDGFGGTKRTIYVRLNMKVSEEILREIALELKSKETQQYEYTRITFFLPGKGPDKGPGNTDGWALADFDSGLKVLIMGFTLEEERYNRTAPLSLPLGDVAIGTWIQDNGFAKTRTTIYRHGGRYALRWGTAKEPSPKEMNELPTERGRVFKMKGSSDQYVLGLGGDLEIYDREGKLISRATLIVPPPPDR